MTKKPSKDRSIAETMTNATGVDIANNFAQSSGISLQQLVAETIRKKGGKREAALRGIFSTSARPTMPPPAPRSKMPLPAFVH